MARIEDLAMFVRKVPTVFAVQMTAHNQEMLAQLLSGGIWGTALPPEKRSVRFHIHGEEFVVECGDVVTWQGGDVLIYSKDELELFFDPIRPAIEPEDDPLGNALIAEYTEQDSGPSAF